MTKKNPTRGGSRPGAGRPSTPWRGYVLQLHPDQLAWIDEVAATCGWKRSEALREILEAARAEFDFTSD